MIIDFWKTDLSGESGTPWFSTHLRIRIFKYNAEFRRMTPKLVFWRVQIFIRGGVTIACSMLRHWKKVLNNVDHHVIK
jgi:hypothetical protein